MDEEPAVPGPMTAVGVAALVAAIEPFDALEAAHRADALAWLAATDDVFRRVPPRTPPKHLVSYFLIEDPADHSMLLGHHRRSGLWLPPGGHVEAGEDPLDTVRREALEELGRPAVLAGPGTGPRFVTVTPTTGPAASRHVDVSLWYLLLGARTDHLHPDEREFAAVRWWDRSEVAAADPCRFDPHLGRFLAKVAAGR